MAEYWRAWVPNQGNSVVRVDRGTIQFWPPCDGRPTGPPVPLTGTAEDAILATGARTFGRCLGPGEYHPRVCRLGSSDGGPSVHEAGLDQPYLFNLRSSRALFAKLHALFHNVEPDSDAQGGHDDVYSHEIRELLILACTEVESSWKSVLRANSAVPLPPVMNTGHYIALLPRMKLDGWVVLLAGYPDYRPLAPFASWNAANTTTSLRWYDAYNAVKHDREGSFRRATLGSLIDAMAAVYIMRIAQFGAEHVAERDEDPLHGDAFDLERLPQWDPEQCYIGGYLVDEHGTPFVPSLGWATPRTW